MFTVTLHSYQDRKQEKLEKREYFLAENLSAPLFSLLLFLSWYGCSVTVNVADYCVERVAAQVRSISALSERPLKQPNCREQCIATRIPCRR
jgi:hypothetical protein